MQKVILSVRVFSVSKHCIHSKFNAMRCKEKFLLHTVLTSGTTN